MNSIVSVKLYSIFGYFFLINPLFGEKKMVTYFFLLHKVLTVWKKQLKMKLNSLSREKECVKMVKSL